MSTKNVAEASDPSTLLRVILSLSKDDSAWGWGAAGATFFRPSTLLRAG